MLRGNFAPGGVQNCLREREANLMGTLGTLYTG